MRHLFLLLATIGISACASNSQSTKYYSLNLRMPQQTSSEISSPTKTRIVFNSIALAQFLNQDRLVMQIGEHEIHFAEYHRWAEPLEKEITQLVTQELNNRSKRFEFIELPNHLSQEAALQLYINVDKFHSTDRSKIILSGQFWIMKHDKPIGIGKSFNITDRLIQDGYLHSVKKLQQAIGSLSQQVVNLLNTTQDNLLVDPISTDLPPKHI